MSINHPRKTEFKQQDVHVYITGTGKTSQRIGSSKQHNVCLVRFRNAYTQGRHIETYKKEKKKESLHNISPKAGL